MTAKLQLNTWKDWVLTHEVFYFARTPEQIEQGAMEFEGTLYADRWQAIYHSGDNLVFGIWTRDLDHDGFQPPKAPKGIKGTTPEKWIERWYRGSSVKYRGTIAHCFQVDPFDDVRGLVKVDVSKARLEDQIKSISGLRKLVIDIPAFSDALTIYLWGRDVHFGLGEQYKFYHTKIEDGENEVLKVLYSEHFAKVLCESLLKKGFNFGPEIVGIIDPDLVSELFEEFKQ